MSAPLSFETKPMDRLLEIVTLCYLGACLFFSGLAWYLPRMCWTALALIFVAVCVWGWLRPTCLEVDAESLSIVWPWHRRRIPRADIVKAWRVDWNGLRPLFRAGVGGVFGMFGWFLRPRKGWIEAYVTSRYDLVLLESAQGQRLVLSPQDPKAFLLGLGLEEEDEL
jgi:hypothetical protein